jgi:hypothetical protein
MWRKEMHARNNLGMKVILYFTNYISAVAFLSNYNRMEQNLFTFHRSFTGLSQGCRTCHSTNTILVSNTNVNINYTVETVIYSITATIITQESITTIVEFFPIITRNS